MRFTAGLGKVKNSCFSGCFFVLQRATKHSGKEGFHIDSALNGIAVAAWRNQPNHQAYNNKVFQKLEAIKNANPNLTPEQAYQELKSLITTIRNAVVNNPNTHLNQLIF